MNMISEKIVYFQILMIFIHQQLLNNLLLFGQSFSPSKPTHVISLLHSVFHIVIRRKQKIRCLQIQFHGYFQLYYKFQLKKNVHEKYSMKT